jgi:hypothetical protein
MLPNVPQEGEGLAVNQGRAAYPIVKALVVEVEWCLCIDSCDLRRLNLGYVSLGEPRDHWRAEPPTRPSFVTALLFTCPNACSTSSSPPSLAPIATICPARRKFVAAITSIAISETHHPAKQASRSSKAAAALKRKPRFGRTQDLGNPREHKDLWNCAGHV